MKTPQHPPQPDDRATTIRRLNDAFRRGEIANGKVIVTSGVNSRGLDFVLAVFDAVQRFDDFTPACDPYGEHDFGVVTVSDETIFWKIDYFDQAIGFGSPDAADADVTVRVLTVMLSEEY